MSYETNSFYKWDKKLKIFILYKMMQSETDIKIHEKNLQKAY